MKHRLRKVDRYFWFTDGPSGGGKRRKRKTGTDWKCIRCGEKRSEKHEFNDIECEEPNWEMA